MKNKIDKIENSKHNGFLKFVKYELEKAGHFDKNSMYEGLIGKKCFELMELFNKQNHSNNSANLIRHIMNRLIAYLPLSNIEGTENEWRKIGKDSFKNNRLSGLFKEKGIITYSDAIHFKNDNGNVFISNKVCATKDQANIYLDCKNEDEVQQMVKDNKITFISSKLEILKFPFMPKTFEIEVEEAYSNKHTRVSYIKHILDLIDVSEYYRISKKDKK